MRPHVPRSRSRRVPSCPLVAPISTSIHSAASSIRASKYTPSARTYASRRAESRASANRRNPSAIQPSAARSPLSTNSMRPYLRAQQHLLKVTHLHSTQKRNNNSTSNASSATPTSTNQLAETHFLLCTPHLPHLTPYLTHLYHPFPHLNISLHPITLTHYPSHPSINFKTFHISTKKSSSTINT